MPWRGVCAVPLLGFWLVIGLSGCSGLVAPEAPGVQKTVEELAAAPGGARLQILITYNGTISTHAALRLEDPGRSTLFWDPAGLFGRPPSAQNDAASAVIVPRHNDVIWSGAPTLPAYWQFAEFTGDTAMEVLEWNLSDAQAEDLYVTLVQAAQPGGAAGFGTATTEPFCAIAVSEFLRRFASGVVAVPETYLFPTSLAEQLRTQNPDRVVVFTNDQPPVEYRDVGSRKKSDRL